MKKIVIDATVVVKWYLNDEEHIDQAVAVRDAFLEDRIELIAPVILPVEWANAIYVSVKQRRFPEERWRDALTSFDDYQIPMVNHPNLLDAAWFVAQRFNRSMYDAVYLALAELEGFELLTGDRKLFNSVQGHLQWVKWLGDFSI